MKGLLLLAVACIGFASCSPPPFDLSISLSTLSVKGMTSEGTIGPIDKMSGSPTPQDAVFIPEYTAQGGLDVQNGFLVYTQPDGRRLGFVTWDPARGMPRKLQYDFALGPAPGGDYPDLLLHLPRNPSLPRISGIKFDPANPYNTGYGELTADIPSELVSFSYTTQPGFNLPPLFGVTGKVIGVTMPPSSSASDTAYFLAQADVTGNVLEFSMTMIPGGLTFLSATRGFLPYDLSWLGLPGKIDRVQYFYDPAAQRSYLSMFDPPPGQNRWRCWSWTGTTAGLGGELAGIDHRIDALLSTGELFSTQDDVGRVYGSDGTLRAQFPLTGVTFVDERSVAGTARLIFSQSLFYGREQHFNVYSIPTTDLKTLATN